MSANKKINGKKSESSSTKKEKKNTSKEDKIDPHQEQINELIREREDIRKKFNTICAKIVDNINIDDYHDEIDFTKQEPSDISLDHLLSMIDDICYYRTALLNLYHEGEDVQNKSVHKRITQLAVDEPNLVRKRLSADQRLTFVSRERDIWKENAELLQIMYGTIVDQLEMGLFNKYNTKSKRILQSHRLNLEDVCLIFSSPKVRSIHNAQKVRTKNTINKESQPIKNQQTSNELDLQDDSIFNMSSTTVMSNLTENKDNLTSLSAHTKRTVLFSNEVSVISDDKSIDSQRIKNEPQRKESSSSLKIRLPLASEIPVDQMDSNLRMLIIKELSKDSHSEKPPSRMSSNHAKANTDFDSTKLLSRTKGKTPEWIELARLIGINQAEIEHWLSQNLQYPAGRVISSWCNTKLPSPTVAQLHSLLATNTVNRLDLARHIEAAYCV